MQLKGYTIRWATYSEGGFKEGVSLTCDDELNRWQKYSYGRFFALTVIDIVLTFFDRMQRAHLQPASHVVAFGSH